jgi:hypothetical protein
MRVPESAPEAIEAKAVANPSVTRVEASAVPAAKNDGKSSDSGAGDP